MASISSLTGSSSTSSIYGNRNVISGLASGMDTEAMIENSISGYKSKITNLQKQQVKTEWKQDAYRSIISKMVGLTQKYTSYTSSTNLFSNSFFNRAVKTVANGKYADKVSATGKSSSDIKINSIESVASAARYAADAGDLIKNASKAEDIDWSKPVKESTIAGSMSLVYGSNNLTIRFGEDDIFEDQQALVDNINQQLADQTIKSSGGASKASEFLEAKLNDDGRIVLQQKAGKDNKFYIASASDSIKDNLLGGDGQIGEDTSGSVKVFGASKPNSWTQDVDMLEHLKSRTMSFTFNGTTKTISLGDTTQRDKDGNVVKGTEVDQDYADFVNSYAGASNEERTKALAEFIKKRVNKAFGENKIEVGTNGSALDIHAVSTAEYEDGKLIKEDTNNYTLTVSSSAGRALGLGTNGIGNTLNTGWTLGDVFGDNMGGLEANETGKYDLIINGKNLGEFGKDTKIESVLTAINNNADAGVNVSFSKLTNEFVFTAREMGADQEIDITNGLAAKLFGNTEEVKEADAAAEAAAKEAGKEYTKKYTEGTDSKFTVSINGTEKTMTRSSNVVDLDGLSVTLKGTFSKSDKDWEPITFTSTTDSDTIVDAIKSFVEDYNAMAREIHDAYSTLPYQKSSGAFANYEPLVGDEADKYSESELKRYEEKAKQGILFGDSDLRSLYQSLTGYIQGSGIDGATLRSIGIETAYDNGMTTLSLNENKLREALTANPDKVRDAFTKTTDNGASSNGLMQNIKTTLERYSNTSIASPGILVQKAGTPLSSYSLQNNQLQNQLDNFEKQIEKWQDKMSDRIDYYTNQFTRLEQLINQMNSQSSALAGLMGG